jgi:hypothetical protein
MDTLIKNKKNNAYRWIAYNREYISIHRENGITHYYKYNARRIYLLLDISKKYALAVGHV